jgi:curved DNA-binding protein CbpA
VEQRENYYAILGLTVCASMEEIHEAYRKLAKENHPDLKGKDLEETMIEINNAYRTLKDPQSRDEYNFNGLLLLRKLPGELVDRLPSKVPPRKGRPLMQTVVKKITGRPTLYTMTAVAIRFKTAMMYASSPKPMHQEMAIEELKKGIELEPKHADSLYNLGILYCKRGEIANALFYFKKFLQMEKDGTVADLVGYIENKLQGTPEQYRTKRLDMRDLE